MILLLAMSAGFRTIHFIGYISINLPGIGLGLFNTVESINLDNNDNLQYILHTI